MDLTIGNNPEQNNGRSVVAIAKLHMYTQDQTNIPGESNVCNWIH